MHDTLDHMEHNGENLTILTDYQYLSSARIEEMKDVAERLLYSCSKLTNDDLILRDKLVFLQFHPSMFERKYGENDPLWIEFGEEVLQEEKEKQKAFQRKKIKGHIYFVKCLSTNLYKIGYSSDIDTRIKNLKNSSSTKLKLIKLIESDDCLIDERHYHKFFSEKRKSGEWFDLDISDLKHIGVEI